MPEPDYASELAARISRDTGRSSDPVRRPLNDAMLAAIEAGEAEFATALLFAMSIRRHGRTADLVAALGLLANACSPDPRNN